MPRCPHPSKTRYRDRLAALSALAKIRARGTVRSFDLRGAYECTCGSWHLTHHALPSWGAALPKEQKPTVDERRGPTPRTGTQFHVVATRDDDGWLVTCVEEPDAILRVSILDQVREIAGVIAWLAGKAESDVRLKIDVADINDTSMARRR